MDLCERLQAINAQLLAIGDELRRQRVVYDAELSERLALGLTGQAAIDHYNEWMLRYGMPELRVNFGLSEDEVRK